MKNLKSFYPNSLIKVFVVLLLIFVTSCRDFVQEEVVTYDPVSDEETMQWNDLLPQLDLSSTIIVQKDESIQDAVDAALPGDVIYIEPGIYEEALTIDKSDIKLVGLGNSPKNQVILNGSVNRGNAEIFNIQATNLELNRNNISTLKSARIGRRMCLLNMTREELGRGIAHYQFEVAMGKGQFDIVRIHRVVREHRLYRPVRTKGDIFMIHGAIQDFDDIFLTAGAEEINAKTSSPFYLASKNIDVWGIDMGWTMVPLETQDFSFMEGWGVEKDIDHALKAMSIARIIRGLTGQGFCRMNLLGFSYGVDVAYGAASRETQQHWICRDIKGLIPVDRSLKTDDSGVQAAACTEAGLKMEKLNNGEYVHPWGVGFLTWGDLALNDPNGDSPFYPGLSNSEFLMWVGSQGFFAGNKDEFFYTDPLRFFRLSVNLAPYWPMQINYELSAVGCPTEDVTYDDHLGEISLPILYIGAEAGEGEAGIYTSSLTASTDITNHIVPGYSHADLWFSYDADDLVWGVLNDWLINHSEKNRRGW